MLKIFALVIAAVAPEQVPEIQSKHLQEMCSSNSCLKYAVSWKGVKLGVLRRSIAAACLHCLLKHSVAIYYYH